MSKGMAVHDISDLRVEIANRERQLEALEADLMISRTGGSAEVETQYRTEGRHLLAAKWMSLVEDKRLLHLDQHRRRKFLDQLTACVSVFCLCPHEQLRLGTPGRL